MAGSAATGASFGGATATSNQIGTLAGFSAGTGFALTDASSLTVAGPVTGGTSATITDNGALTIAGNVTSPQIALTGRTIAINGALTANNFGGISLAATAGGITEAGSMAGTRLSVSATDAVTLTGASPVANQIGILGPVATPAAFALSDGSAFAVNGTVAAGSITLRSGPGISLGSGVPGDSIPGQLVVPSGGRISVATDILNVLTPGSISAPGGTVELAPFTIGSPVLVSQATATDLAITPDAIAAISPTAALLRIGQLAGEAAPRAGSITFSAPTDFTGHAAIVELDTTGGITQAAGAIVTAPTLTGRAGLAVTLTGGNRIGTLDGFSVAAGNFALTNGVPLTMTGLLSAPNLQVSAIGQITLAGTIATNGAPVAAQSGAAPAAAGSYILVAPDAAGAGNITQRGTSGISGLDGGTATLRLQLPATGGSMVFNDLEAEAANLVPGHQRRQG